MIPTKYTCITTPDLFYYGHGSNIVPPLSVVVGRYHTSEVSKTADSRKRILSDSMTDVMLEVARQRRRERGWRGLLSNALAKSEVAYYNVEELSAPYLMSAWLESNRPSTEASLFTQLVRVDGAGKIIAAMEPSRRAIASRGVSMDATAWSEVLFPGTDYGGLEPESKLQLIEDVTETVNLIYSAQGMTELTFSIDNPSESTAS